MSIKKGDTVEWINEGPIYQAENGAKALVVESPKTIFGEELMKVEWLDEKANSQRNGSYYSNHFSKVVE